MTGKCFIKFILLLILVFWSPALGSSARPEGKIKQDLKYLLKMHKRSPGSVDYIIEIAKKYKEDAKKEVPTLVVPTPKLITRDSILLHPQEPKPLIESIVVEGPRPYLNMQQSHFTQEFDHIAFINKAMEKL